MSMPQPETEPIVGYRAWIPSEPYEGKVVLRSAVKMWFSWPHRLPVYGDVATTGGVYAFKNLSSVFQMFGYEEDGYHLFGEVYLWGRVMQHADGYRAEFAYPKRFFVDSERGPEFIMALEDSYGVPVEIRAELDFERKKWEVYRQKGAELQEMQRKKAGTPACYVCGIALASWIYKEDTGAGPRFICSPGCYQVLMASKSPTLQPRVLEVHPAIYTTPFVYPNGTVGTFGVTTTGGLANVGLVFGAGK